MTPESETPERSGAAQPRSVARSALASASVVVVGIGGLGCPALWALAQSGIGRFLLLDDDVVDESNLGRQLLYGDEDVGEPKLDAARRALVRRGVPDGAIELCGSRLLPENARETVRGASVVIEGADNYATKFLTADACHLEGVPVVHGAALGWQATVWAVAAGGGPCYRCLFEDVPETATRNCENAGVIGPVTGLAGALMAELTFRILSEDASYGFLTSYDGQRDKMRRVPVAARPECPLCGSNPNIFAVDEERYSRQTCAA